jgi:sulfoxide reductase heme-binding subunit YedZ
MQKFRGFDPRTGYARWGLVGVGLGIVLGATLPQAFDLVVRTAAEQQDKLPWYASRLLAFLAYLAIAGSVVYGLLLSTGILDALAHRPITIALHQDLAYAGFGLSIVHGGLLGLDRTIHFSLADLLVPFASPFRPLWVGFGQLALYVTLVVIASFHVRRRIGQRAWRTLHYLTVLVFLGVTAHGIMSGTDTATPWAWWLYVGSTMAVIFLTAYRIVLSVATRGRSPQRLRAAPDTSASGPLPRPVNGRTGASGSAGSRPSLAGATSGGGDGLLE